MILRAVVKIGAGAAKPHRALLSASEVFVDDDHDG